MTREAEAVHPNKKSGQPGRTIRSLIEAVRRWPRPLFLGVSVGVLALGAILGGIYGDAPIPTQPSNEMAANPAVKDFVKVIDAIEENYAVAPDQERLTRGAVLGMLRVLDPHSNFFDRREFSEMQDEQSSHFYGIGVTVNRRNDRIYVLGVSPGMPAERAGLRYGDAIVAVDGISAKGWEQSDAMRHVRGERGTEVKVTFERAGEPEPLTVTIERDEVPFPSVRSAFMLRPDVGFIALTGGFSQETGDEVGAAIERLKQQKMASLIVDLRNNPGGFVKKAVQVAEMFLPKGVEIVSVRGREGRYPDQKYASENRSPETMPLIVLIDADTASASEIVASALQDRQRALLIGEESFGKGLVQTIYPLRAGTGLTLTTARYYTPNGRSIQRPYNGVGFYEYYFSRQGPSEGVSEKRTNASRSARVRPGGIKPDIQVALPPGELGIRDACFEFARQLVAGQIPGHADYVVKQTQAAHRLGTNEFPITDQLVNSFREFLRTRTDLRISESRVHRNQAYIRTRIRAELITAAYGIEAAEQFLLDSDPQVMRAIEEIPKARQLRDHAKLFPTPAERQ